MRRLILSIFVALCCYGTASAIPAYRGWITFTQPDGTTLKLRQNGDEFCHWLTNMDGDVVAKGEDGFYRVVSESTIQSRKAAGRIRRSAANSARRSGPAKAGVATGQKHFLVVLVQFSDVKFNFSSDAAAQQAFHNLLNQNNYSGNGGHGSARDFYYDNSHGYFEPVFDVYGPVTLNHPQAYYGGNDSNGDDLRPEDALIDGINALSSQINFSQLDNDGDGKVDVSFMFYAGNGEADSDVEDSIWPHQWELSSAGKSFTVGGKTIDRYICSNEIIGYGQLAGQMCGIGTTCHEFGHAMGLPDFYDTDYKTNGEAGGLYAYSTMCSGSYNDEGRRPPYFNTEERIMLGWPNVEIREIVKSGTYTLTSVNNNIAYKSPTDKEGEYFLYECRSNEGWDKDLPEHGLIVYHVDKSDRIVKVYNESSPVNNQTAAMLWGNWEKYNSINENGSHPCFYLVPAGAQSNLNYSGSKWAFTGASGRNSFTATSWNGVESDVHLSDISYADNRVSLFASVPSSVLNYNVIANPGGGVYAAGSSFALELVESEAQPVSSVLWYFDDEPVSGSSVRLTAGRHVVEAHLTLASGETKILELTLNAQ